MKPQFLDHLRCPECRATFALRDPVTENGPLGLPEVASGRLVCGGCAREYAIRDGVPRLAAVDLLPAAPVTHRTASSFGFLWTASDDDEGHAWESGRYHFLKLSEALGLPQPDGVILDAGCGEGIDVVYHGLQGSQIVGVELSDGGCATTFRRTARLPAAHVAQADLRRLPFADATFRLAYSYGVLHHVAEPEAAIREIARVTQTGGLVAVYLYEDFAERALGWRVLLRVVNQLRHITVRFPHRLLYTLCQIASPLVFVVLTVPSRVLSRIPASRVFASRLPYNFGTGPFSMVGDLYDRFSAPVEARYSRESAAALIEDAGFRVSAVANNRGWMIAGEKR